MSFAPRFVRTRCKSDGRQLESKTVAATAWLYHRQPVCLYTLTLTDEGLVLLVNV